MQVVLDNNYFTFEIFDDGDNIIYTSHLIETEYEVEYFDLIHQIMFKIDTSNIEDYIAHMNYLMIKIETSNRAYEIKFDKDELELEYSTLTIDFNVDNKPILKEMLETIMGNVNQSCKEEEYQYYLEKEVN